MSRNRASIAIMIMSSLAATIGCHTAPTSPLPDAGEIKSMRALLATESPEIEFDVPSEHYAGILASLLPCKYDSNPSRWMAIGELHITHTGGETQVNLYSTSSGPPGAFSAGPSFEQRIYYRGGDSDELLQAMKDAYAASKADSK